MSVGQGVTHIVMAVTGIAMVRHLGLSLYSQYATAMAFMGFFGVLTRLGFNRVFLRECSRDPSKMRRFFAAAFLLNGTLSIAAWLVALTLAYYRYDSQVFTLTVLLGASVMVQGLRQTPMTAIQVHQKLHLRSFVMITTSICYAAAVFYGIQIGISVVALAVLHLATNVLAMLLSCCFSFQLSLPKPDLGSVRELLSLGIRFCAIDIMMTVYMSVNAFVLASLNMQEQVGIYNVAYRLFAMLQMMAQVIDSAVSPAIYSLTDAQDRMIRGIFMVLKYFTVSGLLLGAACMAQSEWIITTLFGSEFKQGGFVLMLLGPAIACRFIIILLSHIIYAKNQESFMLRVMTILAIAATTASVLLIPGYGAKAAGAILLFNELCLCLVCIAKCEKLLDGPGIWKRLIAPLLAGIATFGLLYATVQYALAGLLVSPVIFAGFLFMIGYYRKEEAVAMVRAFWKRS